MFNYVLKYFKGRLSKQIGCLFILKALSLLLSFLYVPLLLHSLDENNYAIWLTLTSIVSWITIFDIGIGNGLRNKVAEALAVDDVERAKSYISTAYIAIFLIASLIAVVFLFISGAVNWNSVLNAENIPPSAMLLLVRVVTLAFCFHFAVGLITLILYGVQKVGLSATIGFLSQLITFIVVYIFIKIGIANLITLGVIISLVPPLMLLLSSVILFRTKLKNLSPDIRFFRKDYVKDILNIGVKFFIIQIITIVLFQANNLIITHSIDNAAVVEYNIAYKYMHIIIMLFGLVMLPMWSATTDAYFKGNLDWIRSTCRKLKKLAFLFIAVGALMLVASPLAYRIWLNDPSVKISFLTTFLLFAYSSFNIFYSLYGYLLNGIGKLTIQVIVTLVLAVAYIPLAFYSGRIFGLKGVLVIFMLTSIINCIWSRIQFGKILSGTATGLWNK